MDEGSSATPRVVPNRAALIAIAALANGIGLAPYLLFIDRLHWLAAVVPASAAVAVFALRTVTTEATRHPALKEWLLGAWSTVAAPSGVSLVGLMFFGFLYGAVRLYQTAAEYLGYAAAGDPFAWGYWGSVWFVAIGAFLVPTEGIRELARRLYPREAWARTVFHPFLSQSKRAATLAAAAGALAALVALFWFLDPHGAALPVLLTLVLSYSSFPLAELGVERTDAAKAKIVDALAALLPKAGYDVVRAPRTGKPEIDPLLQSVDLLARSPDRVFAIEVKAAAAPEPLEWTEATAVRTAAALLSEEIDRGDGRTIAVEPVLLVVGGSIAQSLRAFSQREGVPLVHFEETADAAGDRDELARRLMAVGIDVAPRSPVAPSAGT